MKSKTPLIIKERLVRTHRQGWQLKYYTCMCYCENRLKKDDFVEQLATRTNFSKSQILFLFNAASELLLESIESGHIVDIPFWGIFKMSLHAKISTDRDAAGPHAITQMRINFKPHVTLLERIANLEFETEYKNHEE